MRFDYVDLSGNSARSNSTSIVNVETGDHFSSRLSAMATHFNLFNAAANDISHARQTRLPGESQPVAGTHFHPGAQRTRRVTATLQL